MQDRIKQMAREAGFELDRRSVLTGASEFDRSISVEEYPVGEAVLKLIQLVAEDCAEVADNIGDGRVGSNDGNERAAKSIRARYGIKE
ncbi:MAG TPA: hypothetical protein VFM33_13870 [Aquabacterium sp.]|nr:hypothetical protein [Aquabacterium sp.]